MNNRLVVVRKGLRDRDVELTCKYMELEELDILSVHV